MSTEAIEEGNQAPRQPDIEGSADVPSAAGEAGYVKRETPESASDASRDTLHASRASERDLRDALARLGRHQEGVMADAARKLLAAAITELFNFRAGAPPVNVQQREHEIAILKQHQRAYYTNIRERDGQLAARDRQIADLRGECEQLERIAAEQQHASDNHAPLREAVVACHGALQSIKVHSAALVDADLVPVVLTHAFALHRDWSEQGLKASADALTLSHPGAAAHRTPSASDGPSEISNLKSPAPEST